MFFFLSLITICSPILNSLLFRISVNSTPSKVRVTVGLPGGGVGGGGVGGVVWNGRHGGHGGHSGGVELCPHRD